VINSEKQLGHTSARTTQRGIRKEKLVNPTKQKRLFKWRAFFYHKSRSETFL